LMVTLGVSYGAIMTPQVIRAISFASRYKTFQILKYEKNSQFLYHVER
jgi:hypothetical protein